MMKSWAFCLLVWGAAGAADAQVLRFERSEPHLLEGVDKMRGGDFEGAEQSFERAQTETKEHRAVVQYNIGSALLEKAQGIKEQQGEAPLPEGEEDPATKLLDRAQDAFGRSYDLSSKPEIRSDAALSLGNVKVAQQDLEGAIEAYRKALVDNPMNGPARNNLLSALRMMQQQPPQQSGGGQGEQDDEDKEGEEGEQQQSEDGEQQPEDGEKKEGEQGEDGEGQQGQGEDQGDQDEQKDKEQDGQQGAQKEQPDDKDKGDKQSKGEDDKDGKKKDEEKKGAGDDPQQKDAKDKNDQDQKGGASGPAQKDKDLDKEEAKRLLDALRKNERPLLPYQMRQQQRLAPLEKTW